MMEHSPFRMEWYDWIAWTAIVVQLFFVYYAVRNYRFALAKYDRKTEPAYRPRAALIVPCKGLDARFDSNIRSLLEQDYGNYRLCFVLGDKTDPAYERLQRLAAHQPASNCTPEILIAGPSTLCSQKIHNLLYAIERLPADVEILAFADSDVCARRDWLGLLVWSLRRPKCGVATGYRWFVPTRNNLATLALSAVNASVAQLLGNSAFNHAWGGSMAVRMEDFKRLGLPQTWKTTLSDDLSLSQAVKKDGMAVTFVPGCLGASYESTTWPKLYEFCRRQFLITRVYAPSTWWLGLGSSLGSVLGLWVTAALAYHAVVIDAPHLPLYVSVPIAFFVGHVIRAILRQAMIVQLLREHAPRLKWAIVADVLGFWLWSIVLLGFILSSAFGRTIRWRGILYRLVSPTHTEVISQ
ncbi:MAG: glycosyltransferase [Sedimentisphaerales bacterium]|nr:glycosyltransferase [Sedimentisphaerales bacterium]